MVYQILLNCVCHYKMPAAKFKTVQLIIIILFCGFLKKKISVYIVPVVVEILYLFIQS